MHARERLRFHLERWIQRGALHQLFVMAALVATIATAGGLLAWLTSSRFGDPASAVWWAFLRLTDPGYLGDDEGALLRVISTVLTVLGYVIFMGSLIAIMTQWLSRKIRDLESGLGPISMSDHVVILGWTNRTPEIVRKLLEARGRLERFLERRDARRLRVVILAQEVDAGLRRELREYLGRLWNENQVFLRSGSSLQVEHLERLDLSRAAAIIVPGADFELGGVDLTDTRIVKTLLALDRLLGAVDPEERPYVVAEMFDPLKMPIARSTMTARLELIASDAIISRLISQSVRHRKLSTVLFALLTHREQGSIYVREFPEFAGSAPIALETLFPHAVVLGAVRRAPGGLEAFLNPPPDFRLEASDLLVLLAPTYDDCTPISTRAPAAAEVTRRAGPPRRDRHRILVLGWSYKVSAMVSDLDACSADRFEVTILSKVPVAERERWLARVPYDESRVSVRHREGDYALTKDLAAADPASFDDIVFFASGWMHTSEEADARTMLGHVLLRSLLARTDDGPEVLIELLDPSNSYLLDQEGGTVLVSPRVLSHVLAHVALRPELNAVFDALFASGGAEITSRRAADYGLGEGTHSFTEVQERANAYGEIALGFLSVEGRACPRPLLAPPAERRWALRAGDEIVALATYGSDGD